MRYMVVVVFLSLFFLTPVRAQSYNNELPSSSYNPPFAYDTTSSADSTRNIQHLPPQKLKLSIRHFDHRKQVMLGAVMMAFIAVVFTTTQQWNP